MFQSQSIRGRILNRALHHQFSRIYHYDRTTVYGSFPSPSKEMTLKFLELVHFDQGGRVFTYVLTLDAQWRFTETGKEFGIDLLSKHTMHSNVSIYIAFSGEFFIRRLKRPTDPEQYQAPSPTHPSNKENNRKVSTTAPINEPPRDSSQYELVIDNDSGTYRPNAQLLPLLKSFMHKNLPGLSIVALDCNADKEKLAKLKGQQRERKRAEGRGLVMLQGSSSASSSISSSDVDDLDALEAAQEGYGDGGDGDGGNGQMNRTQSGKQRSKIGRRLHEIAEPKERIMAWVQDGRERELRDFGARELDDDGGVVGGGGAGAGAGAGDAGGELATENRSPNQQADGKEDNTIG